MKFHEHSVSVMRMVKTYLRRYSLLRALYANALFLRLAVREGLWRALLGPLNRGENSGLQQVMSWDVPFPKFMEPAELVSWLRAKEIQVNEGRCTIYMPPQKGLSDLIPRIVKFYPPNTGFKILKDFRPPKEANYLAGTRLFMRTRLIGPPQNQLVTANHLYSLGIGPRVWDVCCWKGNSTSYTVFSVDHVSGVCPSKDQCINFLEGLKRIITPNHLRILVPNWEQSVDFTVPDCNRNLLFSEELGCAQYVDFQNFSLNSSLAWSREIIAQAKDTFHFGHGRPFRGTRYLYQSIPEVSKAGKRNITKRWAFITNLLKRTGLDLEGRTVLDIGCNAGMILHSSLVAGAAWGLGWDHQHVVPYAQDLLFSLGSSRFQLTGTDLHPLYPLEEDIPANIHALLAEAVVFYLSVRQHIGLLQSLQRIPWRAMVYEGHQRERLEDVPKILDPLLTKDTHIVASSNSADGDSAARPFVILLRN